MAVRFPRVGANIMGLLGRNDIARVFLARLRVKTGFSFGIRSIGSQLRKAKLSGRAKPAIRVV